MTKILHADDDDPQIDLVYAWEDAQPWHFPARHAFAAAHPLQDPKSWAYQLGLLLAVEQSVLPLPQCRTYIASIMLAEHSDPIKVRASRDRNSSGYCHDDDPYHYSLSEGSNDEIRLHLYHRHPSVMLHEVAHALMRRAHLAVEAHGPEFMAACISLLTRHLELDAQDLTASARLAGVEVSELNPLAVPPVGLEL